MKGLIEADLEYITQEKHFKTIHFTNNLYEKHRVHGATGQCLYPPQLIVARKQQGGSEIRIRPITKFPGQCQCYLMLTQTLIS